MKYKVESTGRVVDIPQLPGLTPRGDDWYARAQTPHGFHKPQALEQEQMKMKAKGGGTTSPRIGQLHGSSVRTSRLEGNQLEEDGALVISSPLRPKTASSVIGKPMTATPLKAAPVPAPPATARPSSTLSARPTTGAATGSPRFGTERFQRFTQGESVALRFYAYFLERSDWEPGALGMPDQREQQVRKVVVLYFPEDETLAIHEQRAPNSGIVGGVFFKRSPAYVGPDESPAQVMVSDLAVGGILRLVGREFFLLDCDASTRAYYLRELGLAQPPAMMTYPHETPDEYRAEHATGLGKPRHLSPRPGADGPNSFADVFRKSHVVQIHRSQMDKERTFFAHDGQVLQFDLFWDDRGAWAGQRNVYLMHYYLADDAIEIRTKPQPGFDKVPCLLKRQRLPKNWEAARRGAAPEYVSFRDLCCGETIPVYGREMLLIDCDQFTKDFFRYNFEVEQRSIDISEPSARKIEHPVPKLGDEFLAIGSEEDTLQSVFGQPKPRRDFDRAFKNHNKLLRCKCKLITGETTDAQRRFVLTYFLEDDTFLVYEDRIANSGIVGGTFLRRGRYKHPDDAAPGGEPRYFEPADFYWGATVPLSTKYVMQITEFDENSLKVMEQYKEYFPCADIDVVLDKIMHALEASGTDVRAAFRQVDPAATGFVASKQLFLDTFNKHAMLAMLSEHETVTLLRKFVPEHDVNSPPSDDTPVEYVHMCDMLAFMFSCKLEKQIASNAAAPGGGGNGGGSAANERVVKRRRRAVLTGAAADEFVMLLSIIEVPWRKVFKKFDPEDDGTLTLQQLESSLTRNHVKYGPEQVQYIQARFGVGPAKPNELHLHALCDAIYETNFEARGESSFLDAMKRLDVSRDMY